LNWKKVFVSHCADDNRIIDFLMEPMTAIGIEPFIAERFIPAGQSIPVGIAENIEDSNVFLPVITKNSLSNQWVNQEIGYAFSYYRSNESPFIMPLVDRDQVDSIKGFLAIPQVTKYVALDLSEPQKTIHELISQLRRYIDRNFVMLSTLTVTCLKCHEKSKIAMPSQKVIDEAIPKGPFEMKCSNAKCGELIVIDPYTLSPMVKIPNARWSGSEEFEGREVNFGDGTGLWRIRKPPQRSQVGWIVQFENKAGIQVKTQSRTFKSLDELRAILYG
jgi:hypothetical protein